MMDLTLNRHGGASITAQGYSHASTPQRRDKMSMNYSTQEEGGTGKEENSPTYGSSTDTTFPYGISGVAMPNYGYPGDLYQFTSNGYPRKSRTCCYCGKVFTRSTTRRYHEKRCPLLRAAVCGIVPDNGKRLNGAGMPVAAPPTGMVRGLDSSTTSMSSLTSPKSASHPPPSHSLATTSQLSLPHPLPPALMKQELNGLGYHTSVIVKQESQEQDLSKRGEIPMSAMGSMGPDGSHDLSNMTRLTPDSDRSSPRPSSKLGDMGGGYPMSMYQMPGGMNYSKSLSKASIKEEISSLSQEVNKDLTQEDNGSDLDVPDSETFQERMKNDEARASDLNLTSPTRGDVPSYMEATTSPKLSQENINDFTDISDNEKEETRAIDKNTTQIPGESKCGVCGKTFESGWQLHVHEQIHKKFKPYACRYCGLRFSKAALRIEHEKTHMNTGNQLCAICGTTLLKEQIRVHIMENHREGPWICRHCGKAAITHQDFVEHLQTHELQQEEMLSLQFFLVSSTIERMDGQKDEKNSDVEETYNDGENLNESENVTEQDTISMSDSNDNLTSPGQDSPMENMPSQDQDGMSQEKERCTVCGHLFEKSHMAYHLKCHEGQKPYECPICRKRFGYKNNMKSHIKLHAGIKPYQCNVCGAKFTRGSTLRRHARRHGISAESVWDLFVRNGSSNQHQNQQQQQQEQLIAPTGRKSMESSAILPMATSTPMHGTPTVKDLAALPVDASYSNLYNTSTSAAMSNALLMSYHNHQAAMNVASLTSLFSPLHSTSEVAAAASSSSSAKFMAPSSQVTQSDALNLTTQKITSPIHHMYGDMRTNLTDCISPTSVERSRSRSLSGSDISRPTPISTHGDTGMSQDVGIQVKTCCKSGVGEPMFSSGVGSPSDQASVHSGDSGAIYQSQSVGGLEHSNETIGTLMSTGRLYKCDHCECYFSEYAMYRIHSKVHSRDRGMPFVCMVCGEDCHDRVYFSLHLSEHLR